MGHTNTVLVIEDDETFAATLVDACLMADLSAEIMTAQDALTRVSCDESIRAIILDLFMPEMEGGEFLEQLPSCAKKPRIPVFVASGAALPTIQSASKAARQNGVRIEREIHKPFNMTELIADLRKLSGGQVKLDADCVSKAFGRGEFEQHYQPLMDLRTGKCSAVEALVRWFPSENESIAPDLFIPLIETSALMEPFSLWTIEQAAKQWRRWADDGLELRIAVNLSANSLDIPHLADMCSDIAARQGMPMSQLIVEITETATFDHPPTAKKCLKNLRRNHAKLAVDDFGTGYSSLKQLMNLPYSEVKIDQCFTADILSDKTAEAIVSAVVGLSHSLGYKVIAEGVETPEIDDHLRELGVDYGQGYYYSRPLRGENLNAFAYNAARNFAPARNLA